jgi:hypothetical protein
MAKEATQYFYVAVFGATFGLFGQGVPLPGAPPENISTNGLPTIEGSTNAIPPIISTNILPIVEGGTNAVLTAEEKELQMLEEARLKAEEEYNRRVAEARKKWEAATNGLGSYHVIPGKNPFRLTKPEIPKPKPVTVVKTTITVGVPHLAGISMLRNNKRAVLRINPPRGGAAEYKFLAEDEEIDGVEVLMIDPERGIVEVKVKNRTHSLELDKTKIVSSKTPVRPSGASYRPGSSSTSSGRPPSGLSSTSRRPSGSSSRNTSSKGMSDREKKIAEWRKKQEEARKSGGSRTSSRGSSGSSRSSGSGMRSVPSRNRRGGGR